MKDEARKAIIDAFIAGWTPVPFKVTPDNQPVNMDGATVAQGRLSVQIGELAPAAIGTVFRRTPGMLFLQVFMPPKKGTVLSYKAADLLDSIFCFKRITFTPGGGGSGYVEFDGGSNGPVQAGERDGYVQHNISLNFRIEVNR